MRKAFEYIGISVVVLAMTLVVAELTARLIFGLETMRYARAYDPTFVSGNFEKLQSREQLRKGSHGPDAFGYQEGALDWPIYKHNEQKVRASDRADFLFSNGPYSRYDAPSVDRIICDKSGAFIIMVLGTSLASGASASDKSTTWHALLERDLRRRLGRADIYVVNASMGAFVSGQERLAYELAAVPRDPDMIIFLDGYNDVAGSLNGGYRPGDSSSVPLRYSQVYRAPWIGLLADYSAIFATLYQDSAKRQAKASSGKTVDDDRSYAIYADNITGIYIENVTAVLHQCRDAKRECLVYVQPIRGAAADTVGSPDGGDVFPNRRMTQLHAEIARKIAASPFKDRFFDLTSRFVSAEGIATFKDTVHVNDRGHEILAEAILPEVEKRITFPTRSRSVYAQERCRSLR